MPTYGAAKQRDMARSILPSTKKGGQEDRRRVHKRARTAERALMGCAWEDDEADLDFDTVEHTRSHDTRNMVEERRYKDKVGPFSRWAVRVTENLPQEDRLSYLRSLVPDTLIGEHAVSHVEWQDHFMPPAEKAIREERFANNAHYYPAAREKAEREELTLLVRAWLNKPEGHARLNRAMKKAHRTTYHHYKDGRRAVGPTSPRTLQGVHDVEAFIDALYAAATSTRYTLKDEGLDTTAYTLVRYGDDAGSLMVPHPEYHPEWLDALRALRTHPR